MNIWPFSRIRELEAINTNLNRRLEQWERDSYRFIERLGRIESSINSINTTAHITNRALGRVIAKIDPSYRTDEADPARKAESDRIGDEVIARLRAEHLASNPTER